MDAEQSIKAGNLDAALSQLQQAVRDNPAKAEYRTFLFQLLSVMGNWNRALTQLNVVSDMDAEAILMGQTYRELLLCEAFRAEVFEAKREPLLFGEPNEWVGLLLQALNPIVNNNAKQALALIEAAMDKASARSGELVSESGESTPFEWIADADMRLGPVFEIILNGKYYWVPMESVAEITFTPPEDLRDLVWLPIQIRWVNDGQSIGFMPSRYPGDRTFAEPLRALARKTDWDEITEGLYVGGGQRMFATDQAEFSLLNTRSIVFNDLDASSVTGENVG